VGEARRWCCVGGSQEAGNDDEERDATPGRGRHQRTRRDRFRRSHAPSAASTINAPMTGITASLAEVVVPAPPDGEGDPAMIDGDDDGAAAADSTLGIGVADGAMLGLGVAATIVK